jgi:hypothetical protein
MPSRSLIRRSVCFAAGLVVFAVVCCQAPLYYSNQNQYFVHGLAKSGEGYLHDDWLANTIDPTPVFSALVTATVRWLHPWMFHVYYALVQGLYAAALLGVFAILVGKPIALRRWPIFVALFVVLHSALIRWCSYRLWDFDYPWFLQAGLAGQYVLGAMFQPSTFGVLLLVSIWLFLSDRPYLAAVLAALTPTLHSTYLLPAALVTCGYLVALLAEKRVRCAIAIGVIGLLLVLPVSAYVFFTFRPTSTEAFKESQSIIANFRIPHHARPDLWFDVVAGLQIAWFVIALFLIRRTRLFIVLAVASSLALLLTLAQIVSGSDTLALLFPWRISAVLIPIATTIILSRIVEVLPASAEGMSARIASAVIVAVCIAGGLWIMIGKQGYHTSDEELPLLDYVRRTKQPGDVYFLPVKLPGKSRGALSSDFKPLAEKKKGDDTIPVDLQRFRLTTGAPIYIDYKSIPYKDTDVLEWHSRVEFAVIVPQMIKDGKISELIEELRRRGITHLIVQAGSDLKAGSLEMVYDDGRYQVYRL